MDNKYTFAQLEKDGIEAIGFFDGRDTKGWIMNTTDFVHYANDSQQVRPVSEGVNVAVRHWSFHRTDDTWLHAVIRFKRAIQFPRFSVKEGDRWGFVVYKKRIDWLKAIESGNRFVFAGGDCLAEDVEILYIGTCDTEYSRTAGHIKNLATSTSPAPRTIVTPTQLSVA